VYQNKWLKNSVRVLENRTKRFLNIHSLKQITEDARNIGKDTKGAEIAVLIFSYKKLF
jgi:hypothetical protein